MQLAPLRHGDGLAAHSSTSTLQVGPVHLLAQAHVKPPGVFAHVPPCSQGEGEAAHSSTSTAQVAPVQPAGQAHAKVPGVAP